MAKQTASKHPDWRLSGKERFNYYLSDTGRLFGTTIFQTYMTAFLALRGVDLTILAGVLLVLKIIDAVDDVIFGFLIDKIKIAEWKSFHKITGEGKYLPWFRITFFLCPLFTVLFYGSTPVLMEKPFRTGRGYPVPTFRQRERSWL